VAGEFNHALSQRFQVIRYDSRGQGMSTRGLGPEHDMAAYELDLEAVVKRLRLQRYVLVGFASFAQVAVSYAVKHPQEIEALVLWQAQAEGRLPRPELAFKDWPFFVDGMARVLLEGDDPAWARHFILEAVTQADFLQAGSLRGNIRTAATLIQCPVLLIGSHAATWSSGSEEHAKELAGLIPDSRVQLYDGARPGLRAAPGEFPPLVPAIEDFLEGVPRGLNESAGGAVSSLSGREVEVLKLVALGKSNIEIANQLVISPNTVRQHVSSVLHKVGAANRTEAASFAHRAGLLSRA
jgi:DNA-binding CsgD family transcriptional regulator/pimeloyl-ACP methyl ester carboxylesterase